MPRVLSIDLWDTLLVRSCHPEEIWHYALNHLVLRHRNQLSADAQAIDQLIAHRKASHSYVTSRARLRTGAEDCALQEIFEHLLSRIWIYGGSTPQHRSVAADLVELEVQHLMQCSLRNDDILPYIRGLGEYATIVIASDFYLPTVHVERILRHASVAVEYSRLFISCEIGATKKSGALYRAIHSELGIQPADHVHIGDDVHSDYSSPRRLGIDARLYRPASVHRIRKQATKPYAQRALAPKASIERLTQHLRDVAPNEHLDSDQHTLFNVGKSLSLLFCSFVHWAAIHAAQRQCTTIHYLAREGEVFRLIHERLHTRHLYGLPVPTGTLLRVSRRTTFPASISELSFKELGRYFYRYGTVSPRALLVNSLGLDELAARSRAQAVGVDFDRPIPRPLRSREWRRLFGDLPLQETIRQHIAAKRVTLVKYLVRQGIAAAHGTVALVDLAGHGTIQDNLGRAVPKCQFIGYYLQCTPGVHDVPSNCAEKISYTPPALGNSLPHRFLEQLCATSFGTAIGYTVEGDVVEERNASSQRDYDDYYRFLQSGIVSCSEIIFDWISRHALDAEVLAHLGIDMMSGTIRRPPRKLVSVYFGSSLEDEFLGASSRNADALQDWPRSPWTSIACLVSHRVRTRVFESLRRRSWPQALLTFRGQTLLRWLFNRYDSDRS
jgi:FMN phosphatase YigB (HAD superfamily)